MGPRPQSPGSQRCAGSESARLVEPQWFVETWFVETSLDGEAEQAQPPPEIAEEPAGLVGG